MPNEDPNAQPTIDWTTAPQQFREAHQRQQQRLTELEQRDQTASQLERENAMLRAGVDLDHPAATYFVAGYQGELDPDAIKQEWAKLAPPPAGETPPPGDGQPPGDQGNGSGEPSGDGPTPEELRLQQVRDSVRSGSTPPGGEPSPDPTDDAIHGYVEDRKGGATQVRAQRQALQKIFNAAVAGDERVVSNSAGEATEKWKQRHGLD